MPSLTAIAFQVLGFITTLILMTGLLAFGIDRIRATCRTLVDPETSRLKSGFYASLNRLDARTARLAWLTVERAVHDRMTDTYILETDEGGFKLPLTCSNVLYALVRRALDDNPGCHVLVRAEVDIERLHIGHHDTLAVERPGAQI